MYYYLHQYRPRELCSAKMTLKKKIYVMKSLSEIHNCDNILSFFYVRTLSFHYYWIIYKGRNTTEEKNQNVRL